MTCWVANKFGEEFPWVWGGNEWCTEVWRVEGVTDSMILGVSDRGALSPRIQGPWDTKSAGHWIRGTLNPRGSRNRTDVRNLILPCTLGNYGVTQQKTTSLGEWRYKGCLWWSWYRSKGEWVCKHIVWMTGAARIASCFYCPQPKQRW